MRGLPSGWQRTTLADLTSPERSTVKAGTSDRAYLGLEHVEAHSTKVLGTGDSAMIKSAVKPFERGFTLYARLRPYLNKVTAADFEGVASTEFLVFAPRPWLATRYLLYLLNSPAFVAFANHNAEGIERPRISWQRMSGFTTGLPPLNEQGRIVAAIEEHLSRLDAADASLAAALRRLDAHRSATFTAAIQGYPRVELGAVTAAHRYGTSIKCTPDGPGPPVLRIPNVRHGRIDLTDLKRSTSVDVGEATVESGDLLFIRTNGSRDLIGRVAVVDGAAGMAFASYLIRARPDPESLDSRWAVIVLSAGPLRATIESRAASTAGQYNLNLKSLRSLEIPLPPLEEQRRIVQEVEERLSRIDAMRASIERAQRRSKALRVAILERAFRGELVPQDPTDEPAEALLARIRAEAAASSTRLIPHGDKTHKTR